MQIDQNKLKMLQNGVVLDHIPNDNLMKILHILAWEKNDHPMMVGANLKSDKCGIKGMIKIDRYELSDEQKNSIALFAKGATYNIIRDGEVVHKEILIPHEAVACGLLCPNKRCVSRGYRSLFMPYLYDEQVHVVCHYCDLRFGLDEFKEFAL